MAHSPKGPRSRPTIAQTNQSLRRFSRQAELASTFARTWVRAPDGPIRVVMSVTRRCNLRCTMCRSWEHAGEGELSRAEIGRIVSEMPSLISLDLTGGEPFVRSDIVDLVETVLESAPRLRMLHFTTNGWLGTRVLEAVERAISLRPEVEIAPTVSIDGPPALHDEMRGREGSFDRAVDTWNMLKEVPGLRPYVGTTITPLNAAAVEDLESVLGSRLRGFTPSLWHWNWLQVSSHFFDNAEAGLGEPKIPEGLLRRHLARRGLPMSLLDLMESFFVLNLEFVRRGEPANLPCPAMRSTAFISAEGILYPCHVWDRPIGDLRRGFAEVWRSAKARDVRSEVERLSCGGCFTPCEAYPMFAGAPLQTFRVTTERAIRLVLEGRGSSREGDGG